MLGLCRTMTLFHTCFVLCDGIFRVWLMALLFAWFALHDGLVLCLAFRRMMTLTSMHSNLLHFDSLIKLSFSRHLSPSFLPLCSSYNPCATPRQPLIGHIATTIRREITYDAEISTPVLTLAQVIANALWMTTPTATATITLATAPNALAAAKTTMTSTGPAPQLSNMYHKSCELSPSASGGTDLPARRTACASSATCLCWHRNGRRHVVMLSSDIRINLLIPNTPPLPDMLLSREFYLCICLDNP
jgi:hypothetical protein